MKTSVVKTHTRRHPPWGSAVCDTTLAGGLADVINYAGHDVTLAVTAATCDCDLAATYSAQLYRLYPLYPPKNRRLIWENSMNS